MKTTPIILAAGQGTRMRSSLPKVLHPLGGKPMIWHTLQAAHQAIPSKPVVVLGTGAQAIRQFIDQHGGAEYVIQEQQLGTGHAVQQAEPLLRAVGGQVAIIPADMPLISGQTLQNLLAAHQQHTGPITMLTVIADDPRGFGRVVRDQNGHVTAIVEEANATPEQLTIRELNVSGYCINADWLWGALARIPLSPKGEYYLTDLVAIAVTDGLPVQALPLEDPSEGVGINTRVHLAEAEAILRQRINRHWMLSGVTITDPQTTYIDAGVTIGQDTTILPNTQLRGNTHIGAHCTLGPNTTVQDTTMGDRCEVRASVVENAILEDDVDVGPFSHLRRGAQLGQGVHIGNFGEVKNARLSDHVKVGHFSYIGDATIGPHVNIGAGTITCNFDGKDKHHTVIGANAFIGSDTMLVAPLNIGEGARTGAGSVVTKDVPPHTTVVGLPARAVRKREKSE